MGDNLLGSFIRKKREEMGLSLRGMAEKAQISPSQLSKIESGNAKSPNDDTLERIAYALNADKDGLFALAGKLQKEAVHDAAQYIPNLLGKLSVHELAATYEVDVLPSLGGVYYRELEGYAFDRPEFVAAIIEAVRGQHPQANDDYVILLVKEMIAAHDITVRRHAKRPAGYLSDRPNK